MKCFPFIRVAVIVVSLHSNRNPDPPSIPVTKSPLGKYQPCSGNVAPNAPANCLLTFLHPANQDVVFLCSLPLKAPCKMHSMLFWEKCFSPGS